MVRALYDRAAGVGAPSVAPPRRRLARRVALALVVACVGVACVTFGTSPLGTNVRANDAVSVTMARARRDEGAGEVARDVYHTTEAVREVREAASGGKADELDEPTMRETEPTPPVADDDDDADVEDDATVNVASNTSSFSPPTTEAVQNASVDADAERLSEEDTASTWATSSDVNERLIADAGQRTSINSAMDTPSVTLRTSMDSESELIRMRRRPTPLDEDALGRLDANVIDLSTVRKKFKPGPGAQLHATFSTIESKGMLGNWIWTCRKAGIDANRVIVAALDSATYDWCVEEVKLYVDFSFHCTKAAQGVLKFNFTERRGEDNTFRDDMQSFHAVTRAKVHCIAALLRNGYDVALSDVDVAWIRDPKDYFNTGQLGVTDVAMSADFVFHFEAGARVFYEHEKNGQDGLRSWQKYHDKLGQNPWPFRAELNTGMMFFRCTKSAIRFAIDWSERMDKKEGIPRHDQAHFNELFHSIGSRKSASHEVGLIRAFCKTPVVENEDKPCVKPKVKCPLELSCDYSSYGQGLDDLEDDIEGACPYDACERGQADADLNGTLAKDFVAGFRPLYSYGGSSGSVRLALLPTELFGNGMTYFVKGRNASPHAFAVHDTYVYSGYTSKIWRFREAGLWRDDRDAFSGAHKQDEKTLVVRFNVPPELEEASRSSIATPSEGIPEGHMRALAWQADRLRDAFAIAIITNRTLILPQLLCGCHRHFYFMNNCTLGDHDIPFACPMDHVLRLIKFGSGALHELHVREANYFENRIATGLSRLPAAPRVVFCDHENNYAACAARDGRVTGAVTKTAGYLPTKVDIDESKAAAVLTTGASAADVVRAFSEVEHAPVVVLDGLGASSADGADFLTFGAHERDRWFDERMREVFNPWCCAAEKLGGEIPINITALIKA